MAFPIHSWHKSIMYEEKLCEIENKSFIQAVSHIHVRAGLFGNKPFNCPNEMHLFGSPKQRDMRFYTFGGIAQIPITRCPPAPNVKEHRIIKFVNKFA